MAIAGVEIRSLRAGDAPAVLALARTLQPWFNAEGLKQMETDLVSHRGVVAMQEGRLVGFATWNPIGDGLANLSWMGVAGPVHRRGIGTALLGAIVEELRRRAFHTIEVSTVADSVDYEPYVATRGFYRARGFVDYAVDSLHYGAGEDRYDRLRLRLALH